MRRNQFHWTKWDGNLERPDWVEGEDKERVAIKAQLMKDILPGLLERARNEVTAGNLAKMKEDVTQELKEENRKRFKATGFL